MSVANYKPGIESIFDQDNPLGPRGKIKLTKNGTFDVKRFAEAEIKVEGGVTPTGKINITENGEYDVAAYASANVNVEGIVPSGSLTITENGIYDITEKASVDVQVPSGPTPAPVAKGSIIKLGEEEYKVLSTNEDLTDVELIHVGPASISKWYEGSPTSEQKVTFETSDGEKEGPKYDGSFVDIFCNETFYDTLPADVKAAIIDQEVVQDMYNLQANEGDEDFIIDNSSFGGMVYRLKKINTTSISAGQKHCYMLGVNGLINYYNGETQNGLTVAKDFQLME